LDSTDLYDFHHARRATIANHLPGEQKLMLAALDDAFHCVVNGNRQQRYEAMLWFETRESDDEAQGIFSFQHILSVFDCENRSGAILQRVQECYAEANKRVGARGGEFGHQCTRANRMRGSSSP